MTTMTKEVWFVTGSQHLYGPKVLETVAKDPSTMLFSRSTITTSSVCHQYLPNPERVAVYDELYANYQALASYVNGDKA